MTGRHIEPVTTQVERLVQLAGERRTAADCWRWPGTIGSRGYGILTVHGRQYRAIRVILGLHDATDWLERQACHRCDNRACVNPAHLFIGSIADNQHDKGAKGRAASGEANGGGGKLTADDVWRIRELVAEGLTDREVAEQFPVTAAMVYKIKTNRVWRRTA